MLLTITDIINDSAMSTQHEITSNVAVISVNPVAKPSGALHPENFLRQPGFADKSDRAMHNMLKLVFGVNGSQAHARRTWTFRVIIGSVLMCLGLMFLHPVLHTTAEAGSHGLALVMVAGGAMVACGLLTRVVSISMAGLFVYAGIEAGADSMLGFMCWVCAAFSVMGLIFGSGRYSLDTLLFNALSPLKSEKMKSVPLDHRAYRRLR